MSSRILPRRIWQQAMSLQLTTSFAFSRSDLNRSEWKNRRNLFLTTESSGKLHDGKIAERRRQKAVSSCLMEIITSDKCQYRNRFDSPDARANSEDIHKN
jgi:hypothetical protein